MNEWSTENLKEHIEKILAEKDKALSAALIAVKEENRKTEQAAEKRFELLNELRDDVATKAEVEALEKIIIDLRTTRDTNNGRQTVITVVVSALMAIIVGVIVFFFNRSLNPPPPVLSQPVPNNSRVEQTVIPQ